MKLIIILICLAMMSYTTLPNQIMGLWPQVEKYFIWVQRRVKISNEWAILAIFFLPIIVVFSMVFYVALKSSLAVYALFSLIALALAVGSFSGISDKASLPEIKDFFLQAHENMLAVFFWFVLLGPVGALTYRSLYLFRQFSAKTGSPLSAYNDHVEFLQALADWLPMRLQALLYAFAGDFSRCFGHFLMFAGRGFDEHHQLLAQAGLVAMGIQDETILPADAAHEAQALLKRALFIGLFFLALFTLGAWIA